MHNLSTVIRYEIIRTMKKKTFWAMAFGFPFMIIAIFGIIFFSNQSTNDAQEALKNQRFSLRVTDESGLVNPAIIEQFGASTTTDKSEAIKQVRSETIDAYIFYPKDLSRQPLEVYGKDVGIFENSRYQAVAKAMLQGSVQAQINPSVRSIIQDQTKTEVKTFRGGSEYDPIKQMILPGVFLVLFYLLIAFFGNQMLVSTTEEKENRVIEMILTTIKARTLVVGKIISLIALAFIQGAVIVLPALVVYLIFHEQLSMPSVDLSSLPVNWSRITTGAAIFAISFLLFTGLLVLIGSAVPTAKEANGFIGLIMMLIFGPLYAAPLFISQPDSPFVQFLSLFPLTAPVPLLLRNAVGNLELWEILVAMPVLAVSAVVVLALAVRVFKFGALEYSRKLSVKEIFSRP